MRKIVATEYVSLDGVMDEPGVWSGPFFNDEAAKFKYDELFASDALLLGRVTYEGLRQSLAHDGGHRRFWRADERHAQICRLHDAAEP